MLLVFRFVDIDAVFGGAEPVVRPADSGGILFGATGAIHRCAKKALTFYVG